MAKKKTIGAIRFVKKVAEHRKSPIVAAILQYVAPAIGGYAAVQLTGRIAKGFVAKRWPAYSTHAAIGAKLAASGLLYYATDYFGSLKKHREAILAGAGIALFETLIKALLPGMGWLIDAPAAQSQLDNSDSEGGSVDFEGGEAITGTNADGTKYGPDGRPLADDGDDAQQTR